jgi:NADH-quinone oxidoreductase subunit M
MVNHGLSTGGLFALVGMIYERYHTREIASFGGLARKLPVLSLFMLLFTFSSIGLPGMNGFAGEFLILLGMFQRAWTGAPVELKPQLMAIAVLSVSGVVLGAWYMLHLVQRVFFGPLREPSSHSGEEHAPITDMNLREILALAPLLVFIFWIGLRPADFLTPMNATLDQATSRVVKELEKQQSESALAKVGERGASAP